MAHAEDQEKAPQAAAREIPFEACILSRAKLSYYKRRTQLDDKRYQIHLMYFMDACFPQYSGTRSLQLWLTRTWKSPS